MGLKWLVFLIGPLYLIDMRFGEDQRANIIKTRSKEIGLHPQILISALHSIVNAIRRTYISSSKVNKHALPISITNLGEVHFSNFLFFIFCKFFIVKSLMQHKFCCVNPIVRSWRTWKNNPITPTYLTIGGPMLLFHSPHWLTVLQHTLIVSFIHVM